MGDFNADFGKNIGTRGAGSISANGVNLLNMCKRSNLTPVDMLPMCQGPDYTFFWDYTGQSYIDHCILSERLVSKCDCIMVLENDPLNFSDHLPIKVKLLLQEGIIPKNQQTSHSTRIAWKKVSEGNLRDYTEELESLINQYLNPLMSSLDEHTSNNALLEECFDMFTQIIHYAANKHLPKSKYCRHLKPYWSPILKELVKCKNNSWNEWVKHDKPRSRGNMIWDNYKNAKRSFRREFRKAQQVYENECQLEIDKLEELSLNQFWYLVKKRKPRVNSIPAIKSDDGTIVTDVLEVTNEWRTYFKDLMSAHGNHDNLYDRQFFDM
ncbi:unnamed protein product, partial [Owenia fusiformis]